uniref:Uncharacterized protein n=1 Tax=Lepeophtheirus salmonis TaxID=72036 RepID=A0A0K2T3R2_LEPSM
MCKKVSTILRHTFTCFSIPWLVIYNLIKGDNFGKNRKACEEKRRNTYGIID